MAPLLTTGCKDLAAALGLHARTKSVSFGAAALPRLICTLRQSNSPLSGRLTWAAPEGAGTSVDRQHSGKTSNC